MGSPDYTALDFHSLAPFHMARMCSPRALQVGGPLNPWDYGRGGGLTGVWCMSPPPPTGHQATSPYVYCIYDWDCLLSAQPGVRPLFHWINVPVWLRLQQPHPGPRAVGRSDVGRMLIDSLKSQLSFLLSYFYLSHKQFSQRSMYCLWFSFILCCCTVWWPRPELPSMLFISCATHDQTRDIAPV